MAHFDDTFEPIGFVVDSGDGAGCPCPPHPPCPPPFPPPPPAPKPSAVDDNVPYNPATFADLCKVRHEIWHEAIERINYDKYLSSEIAKLSPGGGSVTVDDKLSLSSTNPVQNKVITRELGNFVHLSGDETISGVKVFTDGIVAKCVSTSTSNVYGASSIANGFNSSAGSRSYHISATDPVVKTMTLDGDLSSLKTAFDEATEASTDIWFSIDTNTLYGHYGKIVSVDVETNKITVTDVPSLSLEDNGLYIEGYPELGYQEFDYGCFATGSNCRAIMSNSFAAGAGSKALSWQSTAIGDGCIASGWRTSAFGTYADAKDFMSFVWSGDGSAARKADHYKSHGQGTFSINPIGGVSGFYIGDVDLGTYLTELDEKIKELSGWCVDEFVKDEFTDFMDVDIHKEIRGGYSDDEILLIGSKKDGLHYMQPGDTLPTRCQCPGGQEEFDGYQFRNIIKGNGCYVATNRDAVYRTNIYTSVDGVTWEKKEHTLKHIDTNGNVCYSDVSKKYYHATLASEYPELSSTGFCVEVSDDLENWSVLTLADSTQMVSSYRTCAVLCAGNYLYITTIGGDNSPNHWYIVVDLTTNTIHKEGEDIFHGYNTTNGWMRWVDGDRIYIGFSHIGVNYSDRIITTADGFDTFEEYVINPDNKLGFIFPSTYKTLIIRSMTRYKGIYYIGTYETASPHILMSYDLKYWHVVSTPVQGIGADMLCPFHGMLYVGYSGDLSESTGTALMADVRYTYHTDHLVINGILNDLEKGGGSGGGGSLAKVEKIPSTFKDKDVRAKVNEIIVTLGGTIDPIPAEFTDDDIKEKVNELISKYS